MYLKDGFTKAHAWDDMMRCVALSSLMLCKIFARWVYLYTRTRWHDAMRCSLEFDMAMRCYIGLEALFFCKIVARLIYKKTHAWDDMAMRGYSGWHATTDFETFEMETIWITGDFRTINITFRSCMLPCAQGQRTESPILFRSCPHCGHETPFSDQKWASKIGDSVLWPWWLYRVGCFVLL
jgi:hypothetical protein